MAITSCCKKHVHDCFYEIHAGATRDAPKTLKKFEEKYLNKPQQNKD